MFEPGITNDPYISGDSLLLLNSYSEESSSLIVDYDTFQNFFSLDFSPKSYESSSSSYDGEFDASPPSGSPIGEIPKVEHLGKNPNFSKSVPLMNVSSCMHAKDNTILKFNENSFQDVYPKCRYKPEKHQKQIKFCSKIPEAKDREIMIISVAKSVHELLPESMNDLKNELENAIRENDSLLLAPCQEKLVAAYSTLYDDPDSSDFLIESINKLIVFTSRFCVSNFSARDASYASLYASYSVSPEHKEFFSELSEVLSCDFIDCDLHSKLSSYLKFFNDRLVIILRWIILNINEGQIITVSNHVPVFNFSLPEPNIKNEEASVEALSMINPKLILKQAVEAARKASMILRKIKNFDAVTKWQEYFDMTVVCFNQIIADFSPKKLIKSGPIFGKTIAALTKFGPASGKLSSALPEVVSVIVDKISTIDEIIGHSRSSYILATDIEHSLNDALIKIKDSLVTSGTPSMSSRYGYLFFTLIKLCSLTSNNDASIASIHNLAPFIQKIAETSPPQVSGLFACIAFQFENTDPTLTNLQKSFVVTENALASLSSALRRSSKKIKDLQKKRYAKQWINYTDSLVECVHALSHEQNVKKQVSDIINVLGPIRTNAKSLNISREAEAAGKAAKMLYAAIVEEKRRQTI